MGAFRFILLVGAVYLDTILSVPHYPAEDEKLRASSIEHRRGGNCPNTIEVLQQLLNVTEPNNLKLALCASLPAKRSAAVLEIQSSMGNNVDLSGCLFRETYQAASSYIVQSEASGSRTIVNLNSLKEMTFDELVGPTRVSCRLGMRDVVWHHFEGRNTDVTLRIILHLRQKQKSAKISVEVEKAGREGLEELAALADIVFYSKSWARYNGYNSAEACLQGEARKDPRWENGGRELYCTWGSDGSAALEGPYMECVQFPAIRCRHSKVVDSVGAGDTFIAGILFCELIDPIGLKRPGLEQKLKFANALAGRKVWQHGFEGLGETFKVWCNQIASGETERNERERARTEALVSSDEAELLAISSDEAEADETEPTAMSSDEAEADEHVAAETYPDETEMDEHAATDLQPDDTEMGETQADEKAATDTQSDETEMGETDMDETREDGTEADENAAAEMANVLASMVPRYTPGDDIHNFWFENFE